MLRKLAMPVAALGVFGALALGGAGMAEAAPASGSGIVDSGTNFTEPDGSVGVGGKVGSCLPVSLSKTGSIVVFSGSLKLFTGTNCTGKSVTVKRDVADLNKIGFGHTRSVRIGS